MELTAVAESWPIADEFRISRGAKRNADVIVVELRDGGLAGRGEAVPYPRYGQSIDQALSVLRDANPDATDLGDNAANNALDCARWDLKAKRTGTRVANMVGIAKLAPLSIPLTISIAPPTKMAETARAHAPHDYFKLKLDGERIVDRVRAVRDVAPDARLIVDANESWSVEQLITFAPQMADLGVELIEQPLREGHDQALADLDLPVAICADESVHDVASLQDVSARYDAVNIKLDKTGGLTQGLAMLQAAQQRGLKTMVGCMVCTSLSIAPAFVLAQQADYADLDGALLLADDRSLPMRLADGLLMPPLPALWG